MTARSRVWTSVTAFALMMAVAYPFLPGPQQRRDIAAVNRYVRRVKPILEADSRFADVHFLVTWAPSIEVEGTVVNRNDLAALHKLIEESNPPVEVDFSVRIEVGKSSDP